MKSRLAFFDRGQASYISSDLELLRDVCSIRRHSFTARTGIQLPWALLMQFLHCLRHLPFSDRVFVHFAGWNSLVPLLMARIFGKRSVLFLHGTDTVSLPQIGYGNFRKEPLSTITCLSLKMANAIVVVDERLIRSVNDYATGEPTEQGIMAHCHGLGTPCSVLPHGFAPSRWPLGQAERDVAVLTVAVDLKQAWRRQLKGIDLLIEAARRTPQLRYVIIGTPQDAIGDLPPNVSAIDVVPLAGLVQWYQRSICYVQVSMSEGFGCALAESMLCGCIPVVSNVGAMPYIVDGVGEVIGRRDPEELRLAILRAFDRRSMPMSWKVRDKVVKDFPMEHRREGLVALVQDRA